MQQLQSLTVALLVCCILEGNSSRLKSFSKWKFSDFILAELPIDQETKNFVRVVKNAIFSEVSPTPLKENHKLVLLSRSSLENCLEITYENALKSPIFRDFSCGNIVMNTTLSHRQVIVNLSIFYHWIFDLLCIN